MGDPFDREEEDLYAFDQAVAAAAAAQASEPVAASQSRVSTGSVGSSQTSSGNPSRVSTGYRVATGALASLGPAAVGTGGPALIGSSRPETSRPQTSIKPAGWPGAGGAGPGGAGATLGGLQGGPDVGGLRAPVARPQAVTPEEIAKEMEREVNAVIEESAFSNMHGDVATALKKAKHAANLNKKLEVHRASSGGMEPNVDLTFSVHFNLAVQFEANKLWDQAIKTYKYIVAQKHYVHAGRLHVNIGNIFYEQEKFPEAIKHYKMAVDKLPATAKELKFKVQRNIGNSHMRMGKLQDAAQVYEAIMATSPDPRSAINMTVCYYALGDKEKMKHAFLQMLVLRKAVSATFQTRQSGNPQAPPESPRGGGRPGDLDGSVATGDEDDEGGEGGGSDEPADELLAEKKKRKRELDNLIVSAALLIAPTVGLDFSSGFDWLIDTLVHNGCADVANELEISKAMSFMRQRNFDKAIETLKAFEKKDQNMAAPAATNLSFLYLLEQDLANAEKYADLALQADRYASRALVNKGCCHAIRGDLVTAREFFLEALGIDADCIEAIYNLGLLSKRAGDLDTALKSFHKLHAALPGDKEVVAQIALLHEKKGEVQQAIRWFKVLSTLVPTDPGVLAKLGSLHTKTDDSMAYQYMTESHRFFPANLHVVSWLGAYYVRSEAHEKVSGPLPSPPPLHSNLT